MMLGPIISASGLVGLLFQNPFFFHVALLFWALTIRLDSGPPGFEKARGAAERDGAVTGQPCLSNAGGGT